MAYNKICGIVLAFVFIFHFNIFGQDSKAANTVSLIKAPPFETMDIFGKEKVSISRWKGKVILLNFWATWCRPCKLEIPDLIELSVKYKNKLVIIGASVDDQKDAVPEFYKTNAMNHPVIYATSKMAADYGGIAAIPTSFVISTNGEIVTNIIGYRDLKGYETLLKQFLR